MTYRYGLFQNGLMVASAEAADQQRALAEIRHYAAVYSQDGPVEIREVDLDAEFEDAGT